MAIDIDDMPVVVRIAMEWSTLPQDNGFGMFDEDPEVIERVRSIGAALLEAELMDNEDIMKSFMTVLGAVPPHVHCPILLQMFHEKPKETNKALNALADGNQAEAFSYRSLIETLGRFARHSLLVDMLQDEDVVNNVRDSLRRAQGKRHV